LKGQLQAPERPLRDRMRDVWRKPNGILGLLDVRNGMAVLDFPAADGYYSEMLAHIVGSTGKVIIFNNRDVSVRADRGSGIELCS
jgi:predicted methyltransferase